MNVAACAKKEPNVTPYFNNLSDFFAMGGHGAFVWASYAITWLGLLGLIAYSVSQRRNLFRDIERQQARQQQRQSVSRERDI